MRPASQSIYTSIVVAAAALGCGEPGATSPAPDPLECSIPTSLIFDGGPGKDGIPALTEPRLVAVGDPEIAYLRDDDRVIGLHTPDGPLAVPLNVGWWHEVVNLDIGGTAVAITHCPLTGSSLAFDRAPADGATFGVSGLLYRNNLIMYDRNRPESLWPQMARGARCGARDGTPLPMIAVIEMTWQGWRSLHADTRVVAPPSELRDYTRYPYGAYDRVGNEQILFPMRSLDRRRPLKERVLGIPDGDGGIVFPFGALAAAGAVAAVHASTATGPVVVFWDEHRKAAAAFRPVANGQALDFRTEGLEIVDAQTESTWSVDGRALTGALAGSSLEAVAEAYVAFWFAWAAFQPETMLWSGEDA